MPPSGRGREGGSRGIGGGSVWGAAKAAQLGGGCWRGGEGRGGCWRVGEARTTDLGPITQENVVALRIPIAQVAGYAQRDYCPPPLGQQLIAWRICRRGKSSSLRRRRAGWPASCFVAHCLSAWLPAAVLAAHAEAVHQLAVRCGACGAVHQLAAHAEAVHMHAAWKALHNQLRGLCLCRL